MNVEIGNPEHRGDGITQSEQWFRTTIDAIPQIVWSCSPEGDCDYLNKRWTEYTGLSYEQGLGSGWFQRVHPEDRESLLSTWLSTVEHGTAFDLEYRLLGSDEKYRWFKGHAMPIVDSEGHIARWLGTSTDIHDEKASRVALHEAIAARESEIEQRQQLEARLRESERRNHAVLDSAIDAFIALDGQGAIIDWNKEAERCFGWAREEALGRSLAETIVPERFRRAHGQGIKAILSDRQGRLVSRKMAMTALGRDGHEFPVEMKVTAVQEKQEYFFAAFVSDISDRVQAETTALQRSLELLEAEARLKAILSSMRDGLAQLDTEGRCVYLNPAAQKIFGYQLDELKGKCMHDLVRSSQRGGAALPGTQTNDQLTADVAMPTQVLEGYVLKKDGTSVPIQYSVSPLILAEKPLGTVVVFRDISDQVKMRAERESFLALLTHDLKTPLIAADQVLGALLQGRGGKLSTKHAEILSLVKKSNADLLKMVQEVLEIYRYSSDSGFLNKEDISLTVLVEECIKTLKPADSEKNAQIVLQLDENVPAIHADQKAVRHLLMNVLWNAIKYTAADGTVIVRLNADGREVVVEIADSGEGIAPEELQQLFQPFWQGALGKRRQGGSGLGLYLCRQIVERHHGKICCISTVGTGTTFSITLPIK